MEDLQKRVDEYYQEILSWKTPKLEDLINLESILTENEAAMDDFDARGLVKREEAKKKAAKEKSKPKKKGKKSDKTKQPLEKDPDKKSETEDPDKKSDTLEVTDERYLNILRQNAQKMQGRLILETTQLADMLGAEASVAPSKKHEGEAQEDVELLVGTPQAMAEVEHIRRMRKARGEKQRYGVGDIPTNKKEFKKKAKDKHGNAPKVAHEDQIKATARIEDKKEKYEGDYSAFTDIARSSLIFNTPGELLASKEKIIKYFDQRGQRIVLEKNRFNRPTDDGYSDMLLNVQHVDGHIFEFQLHIKTLNEAKGHCSDDDWELKWRDMNSGKDKDLYQELRTSAMALLREDSSDHDGDSPPLELPKKARASAVKILAATEKLQFTGHDLYNVKRYLFEKFPIRHALHLEIWTRAAKVFFYGPAVDKINESDGEDLTALKSLTFLS